MSNKYNAKKTQIDGYTFDSKREASRYQELKLLERAGEIKCLEIHPKFLLQDSSDGMRPIYYIADFKYYEKPKWIVEDVKGTETAVFRLKAKLFKALYRDNYEFRIVR